MEMKEILKRVDGWVFGSVAGKVAVGCLAAFGLLMLVEKALHYDYAMKMVRDAQWKAEQAAEEWRGTPLSRNVIFKDYRRVMGKGYVVNLYEGKKTVEGVEWVRPTLEIINEPDSMAVFSRSIKGRGSRKGYLDIYSGRIRIPDKFKHAWNFKNGRYAVACLENDSLYVIDRSGGIVSKRGFRMSPEIRFGFMVNDDLCIMQENDRKFGIINPDGEWVLKPKYDWIVRDPHTGNYKVTIGERCGIVDKEMNLIVPIKYAFIQWECKWDDPNREKPWMRDVAYVGEVDDGTFEYFDEFGKRLR